MLDDFFIRAMIAGIGVSIVAGPLGCVLVWRRMAFYGDTLSHAALLGIVLALLFELNLTFAVFFVSSTLSLLMFFLQRRVAISSDSLLGLITFSSLAIGLVSLSFMTWVRVDVMGFLFGDILAVNRMDIAVIYSGCIVVSTVLFSMWRRIFAATVNYELSVAEGLKPDNANLVFVMLISLVIAICIKIVGVLLITALLIIPAVTARRLTRGPEQMAIASIIIGVISTSAGLFGSLEWDTPSGPSIVVAAFLCFLVSLTPLSNQLKRIICSKGSMK